MHVVVLAVLWLAGFFLFFYSFQLPNSNPSTQRVEIWQNIHFLLLELVDPVLTENSPPSGWVYFPQRLSILLTAGFILLGAWSWGHFILHRFRPPVGRRTLERHVFAFGVGLTALSLLTLSCGLAGFLSRAFFGGVLVFGCFAEFLSYLQRKDVDGPRGADQPVFNWSPPRFISTDTVFRSACLVAVVPFLLCMLLGAMLPSIDFDVKEYHLQGPKEFFQQGEVGFLPHNVYTSFPFLTEMLVLLSMVLKNDWYSGALVGKVVLMAFAPLTALAVFAAARRWFSPTAAWLALLIHLSTPWTYRISVIAYAEGGLTFFLMASLLAVGIGIERFKSDSDEQGGSQTKLVGRQFMLAGLFAGSAMACKYPGVLSVVIPLGAAVVFGTLGPKTCENRWSVPRRFAACFVFGTLFAIGPWLLKNLTETGNPVYPLLYSVFGGEDWSPEMNEKWKAGHSPDQHSLADLGTKFIDVTTKSDWLSPLLFGFAPLAFLWKKDRARIRWLWLLVGYLFLTWWVFTHRIDRFWVPLIPVVSLLAGAGACWCSHKFWERSAGVAIVAACLFNLAFITTGLCGYNAYLIELKAARLETAEITSPEVVFLNTLRLETGWKVLSVGDAELFDAEFPVVYNTVFDRSIFQDWYTVVRSNRTDVTPKLKSAKEFHQKLAEENVRLIYVNWSEILRYRLTYGYTDFVTPKRFRTLQEGAVLGNNLFPSGLREFDSLNDQEQRQVGTWAPELIRTINGKKYFVTAEIFPVGPL